jgi:Secretion system C-terminal sorting domain
MRKILLSAMMIASGIAAYAQSPTTVTTATGCTIFRNFNNSDEGFSSPSIYSSAEDVSFFWNGGEGAVIESSGLSVRSGSLISPVYVQSETGRVTIGFKYVAPVGTQYRVRIVSAQGPDPLEILATSANGPVYTPLPGTSGNICLLFVDADLTIGKLVRFEFTFRNFLSGDVLFDNLWLSVAAGPLPVTFEGFVARQNNDGTVKLLWNVGDEVNVKGYYAESSINGVDFTPAGYVTATGQSIYSLDYAGKLLQTTYFRIKNIDFDSKSKFSPIIRVYVRTQLNAQIQVYPVPANAMVTIQHNKSSLSALISLFTPEGKFLQQVRALPNTFQTQLNIDKLASGIYVVKYDDGNGDIQSIKLIKN